MRKTLLTVLLFTLGSLSVFAQRRNINYAMLANRAATPIFFFDEIILPGHNDSTLSLNFVFRMENNFLTFKKINYVTDRDLEEGYEFYSSVSLNSEIFASSTDNWKGNFVNSVSRSTWQDTVYAKNFDDTQSNQLYTAGYLSGELKPGYYEYLLQLNQLDDAKGQNSTRSRVRLQNLNQKESGEIILLDRTSKDDDLSEIPLLNLGDNVLYGKDYRILFRIPDYNAGDEYEVEVYKALIARKDTTLSESVFSTTLQANQIYENVSPVMANLAAPSISITPGAGSHTYGLLQIPNSQFENTTFQIRVTKNGVEKPIVKRIVRSYWPEMPPALYNLDIAIAMLKFVLPEAELKKMQKGDNIQKEAAFRAFWASKDPTPDTEYNELMTEYYRRVDYAFKEFRNVENPEGQETDRGNVYIRMGPPETTERQFPDKGKVLEIWKYPGQTFVFEKGSGFSDFKLVARN